MWAGLLEDSDKVVDAPAFDLLKEGLEFPYALHEIALPGETTR
jgi:hypothetical protein